MTAEEKRLGELVLLTRLALGLTQEQLASEAGIATVTVRRIERGEGGFRGLTLYAIEPPLGWPTGTAEKILAGGDPPPLAAPAVRPPTGQRRDLQLLVLDRLVELDLTPAGAERRGGLPAGLLGRLARGEPPPADLPVTAIARTLDVDVDEVAAAGAASVAIAPVLARLRDLLAQLPPDKQHRLVAAIDAALEQGRR